MKRKLSIFLMIAMLLSAFSLFTVSAEEISASSSLKGVSGNTGLIADSGSVEIEDPGVLIKTQADSLGSKFNYSRRSYLCPFDDNVILPIGEYTVSLYVYEENNGTLQSHLGKKSERKCEIAVSLHTIGETEETLGYNHDDAKYLIKLFKVDENEDVCTFSRASTENNVKVGNRIWGQYTASITVYEPISNFAFWIIQQGTDGEGSVVNTYVDSLSITQTASTPHTDSITFRGVQNSAIDSTDTENPVFNTRLVSTLDSVDYTAAGYEVTVKAGDVEKSKTLYMTDVYESLTGHKDTTGESDTLVYKREYYNAGAIGAMTIQNLPATGTVTLTVKPFTVGGNKTAPDVSYTVTYVDGVVTEIVTNSAD